MTKPILPLLMIGVALTTAPPLLAQTVPPNRIENQATAPAAGQTGQDKQRQSLSTQMLMQDNGGSLLQASQPPITDSIGKPAAYNNLYAVDAPEPRVLKKHDLVNIVVNEESKSQTSGGSDQERQVDFDAKVDAFVKFDLARFSLLGAAEGANPPEVKLEGQRDFKATGEFDRSDTMITRLEAEVIDVKPDGRLVIQARRHMKIDAEEINIILTGECRVQDVDATNAVLSTDLHDLDLQKNTKGEVHDTTKRGLIHRLLDLVNPF